MNNRPKSRAWASLVAYLSLAWIYFTPVHAQTMDAIKQTIRRKFPDVPQLSTTDLAAWLDSANRPAPLLVDVRGSDEFRVSHLNGAVNATTIDAVTSALGATNRSIVVYCSVGYRSSAFAQKLRKAGITNVYNLDGSIFQWANEGRPVYRGTAQVKEVHPFSRKWGQLLDRKWHPAKRE